MAVVFNVVPQKDIGYKKPSYELVLAGATTLTKFSSPEDISAVLKDAALADLDPVAEDMALNEIQSKTKIGKKPLRQQLKLWRQDFGLQPNDLGLLIARKIRQEHFKNGAHILRCPDRTYWNFIGTHWQETTDEFLNKLLLEEANKHSSLVGNKSLSAVVGEAKRCFDALMGTDDDVMGFLDTPPPVVNCANGELWIETSGDVNLLPHRPESRLTYCLPIEYDSTAACPIYDKTLLEIFGKADNPQDMVRHWHEFVGYAIQSQRDIAVYWLLIGHGSNGKTKLLQTVQRLIGPDAVLNDQIATFQRDRFNYAALAGKLLFIDDDLAEDMVLPDGLLKKISEGKEISARHAYGRRKFKFRCLALAVMAGNTYPRTSDVSHGMVRRARVIPFDRIFTATEADSSLFPKIWEKEMSGILNRALEGLKRLRKRGDFELPKDCERAQHEFFIHANPLMGFIEDKCVVNFVGRVRLLDMRAAMKAWATDQGVKRPPADKTLKRKLQGLGYKVSKMKGYETVSGLALKQ